MKISVIIPFYNGGSFAYKNLTTLSAGLRKAYQSGLDYEILIIDDNGRRDDVEQLNVVIRAIGDSNISTHRLDKNLGPSEARNIGISMTTGDYIWCVDDDDYIDADEFVEASKPLMALKPDILFMNSYYFSPDCEWKMPGFKFDANSLFLITDKTICSYMEACSFYSWLCIAKRQLYAETRFPYGMHMDDMPTISCLVAKAKTAWYHNKPVVHYRQHPDSVMKTWNAEKSLDFIRAVALMHKRINDIMNPVPETVQLSIRFAAYNCLFWSFADAATHRIENLVATQRKCRALFIKEFGDIDVGYVINHIWRKDPKRAIEILLIKYLPSLFNRRSTQV